VEDAPSIQEHLCEDCDTHFAAVQHNLQQLNVPYSLNKFMVRGLDYYCRTTFEFITKDLGSQAAVCAGGRYDGLIEQLGGPKKVPGIGFAMGIERLVLLLQQQDQQEVPEKGVDIFVIGLGEKAAEFAFPLVHTLRQKKIIAVMDHEGRSLKSQMRQANKAGAGWALIIGENELEQGQATLRNMKTQEQEDIDISSNTKTLNKLLLAKLNTKI
jgi:histidyl-tRNA synthetase